jgi:hypothetical protein
MPTEKTVEGKKSIIIHIAECKMQCCAVMLAITGDRRSLLLHVIFKWKTAKSQGTK